MANDILITTESLKHILPVIEDNIVGKAKYEPPKVLEPLDNDIPMVFITGMIPESKKYVSGELEYVSKTARFHAYTYIKLQGNSSLSHPKKNFTINLYADEKRNVKLNKEFKNWGAHNNFVLKADYIDITHARNVVCAKLWSKVVASRPDYDTLPEELRNSPNNGAIDGFPIKVYIDGVYNGLYNWTIPKCAWMFGMDDNNPNHAVLCAEINDNGNESLANNPCNFNTCWNGVDGDGWSIEVGTESQTLTDSFVNFSIDVLDYYLNDDRMDVQNIIDYYIFQDIILGIDGLAKNMLMVTYDMNKWYLSAYDMDSTFDLHWEGFMLNMYGANMPETPYLNRYSMLLNVVLNNHMSDYKTRYAELRNSVLSEASIISAFEDYISTYGEDLYIKDTVAYPDIPSVINNNLSTLRTFIKKRLAYLDNKYMEVV